MSPRPITPVPLRSMVVFPNVPLAVPWFAAARANSCSDAGGTVVDQGEERFAPYANLLFLPSGTNGPVSRGCRGLGHRHMHHVECPMRRLLPRGPSLVSCGSPPSHPTATLAGAASGRRISFRRLLFGPGP